MSAREIVVSADEYGVKWAGKYLIVPILYKEGRDLLRSAIKGKDPIDYMEELTLRTILTPSGALRRESLMEMPNGLIRRLQDATMALNEVGRDETRFLQSSSSSAPVRSRKEATSETSPQRSTSEPVSG